MVMNQETLEKLGRFLLRGLRIGAIGRRDRSLLRGCRLPATGEPFTQPASHAREVWPAPQPWP